MDIRNALKEQYLGGLAMLRQCIERCPDDLWIAGKHPRTFWRIAFHTLYFTQAYLVQNEESIQLWSARPDVTVEVEPYELPEGAAVMSRGDMLEYLAFIEKTIEPTIDSLDLDTEDSGFHWYPGISKLSHELMNVRHIQGHVGQLSELLMAQDIDIDWIAKA